ncbi:SRPBCC domain-containing protein [Pedobacter sandarakinus]|uniref:SRPBCC domain-containing protein n=1 Tax=Pedobacter sandarakinus TaxID=353156 RepID=UPI0022469658|nr:SRPBCC domain-containing protein [Pedobacter sandarakinus]MCX2574671.1 SRPBCC domain-containing protein [Pedobacter sandarakinus]
MEKMQFEIEINAGSATVWETLFSKETYPKWTSAFMEGSIAETDWQTGSKATFTDGKGNGMLATIAANIPNQFLSIRHIGMLKDNEEDLKPEWGEVLENYTLDENGSGTTLKIDMSVLAEWKSYFEETWPKALGLVKEIAEATH